MKRLGALAAAGVGVGLGCWLGQRWRARRAVPFTAEAEALQEDLDRLLDTSKGLAEVLASAGPRDPQVLGVIWSLVENAQESDDIVSTGALLGQVLDLCDKIADGITSEETETRFAELLAAAAVIGAAKDGKGPTE